MRFYLSGGVLRVNRLHPIVLCCVVLTCTHAAEEAPSKSRKHAPAGPPKPHLRASHSGLRPFIFRGGSLPAPDPDARQPRSPRGFNPDPGRWNQEESKRPAVGSVPPTAEVIANTPPTAAAAPTTGTAPGALVPDFSLILPNPQQALLPLRQPTAAEVGLFMPPGQQPLPRRKVRGREVIDERWHYPEYPLGREGLGLLPNSTPHPNRWLINYPHWQRYQDPSIEAPYQYNTPRLWHPYEQSILKGDVPILGSQEIFLNLTAKNFTLFEARKLPTGSGISAAQADSSEFFGRGDSLFLNNDTSFTAELFKGETAFKPVNWALRVTGVYNRNYLWVKENGVLDVDPRGSDFPERQGSPDTKDIQAIPAIQDSLNPKTGLPGFFKDPVNPGDAFNYLAPELKPLGNAKPLREVDPETQRSEEKKSRKKDRDADFSGTRYTRRYKDFIALQEAFFEIHFSDLSNNYDFISSRSGIQPFNSDFRGFIYSDTNLGFRVFGSLDNNKVQYNAAFFDQLEKDIYSDLNSFDSRNQEILILNVYKQDFLFKGYTTQFSFHANWDHGQVFYDKNGFLLRPANIGTLRSIDNDATGKLQNKDVKAYYLGWAGDGHIGRLNITHAFYQVFGEDEFNGIAGQRTDINAQMAALELSYDRDYLRFKLSGFYASGDSNPNDDQARGFDSIQDNPFFIGGPFSWYTHQGFNLSGTSVNLKQRDSLVMDLRPSKSQSQANFVNPGVFIVGAGVDADLTPKLKGFFNANYVWLAETKTIEQTLLSNKIDNDFGLDLSVGFKYRPLLTDNIILSAGVGFFLPGDGYASIYRRNTSPVPGLGSTDDGKVDNYLYNAFFTVTLTY